MTDRDDPKNTQPDQQQKTESVSAKGDDTGKPLTALADRLGTFVDEIVADRETQTTEYKKDRNWQRIVAGLTLAVSIFTIIVLMKTCAVYTAINQTENAEATIMATQAAIMDAQRQLAEKTLPIVKATQDSAQAAQTSANAAQQSLFIQENARIYLIKGTLKPLRIGHKAEVVITYVNRGSLDAANFDVSGTVSFGSAPPATVTMAPESHPTQLIPDSPDTARFYSAPITREQLREVRAGALTLFAVGYFRWDNALIFGRVETRSFCASYNPKNGLGLRPTGCLGPTLIGPNGEAMQHYK